MSRARRRYGVMTQRWGWQPFCWVQNELPSWRPRHAPAGLVTRRQMRAVGLAPGGAEPVAQVVFTTRRREVRALLWDRAELVVKRVATPAQLGALAKAMAARRWCPACTRDVGYCLPTSLGMCVDCAFPEPSAGAEPRHAQSALDRAAEVENDGPGAESAPAAVDQTALVVAQACEALARVRQQHPRAAGAGEEARAEELIGWHADEQSPGDAAAAGRGELLSDRCGALEGSSR